jgi:LEA14-like dessication related protein
VPVRTNLWRNLRDIARMLKQPDQPIRYDLQGELRTGVLFGHDVVLNHAGEITPGAMLGD